MLPISFEGLATSFCCPLDKEAMAHFKARFNGLRRLLAGAGAPSVKYTHAVSSQTLLHADAHGSMVRVGE